MLKEVRNLALADGGSNASIYRIVVPTNFKGVVQHHTFRGHRGPLRFTLQRTMQIL